MHFNQKHSDLFERAFHLTNISIAWIYDNNKITIKLLEWQSSFEYASNMHSVWKIASPLHANIYTIHISKTHLTQIFQQTNSLLIISCTLKFSTLSRNSLSLSQLLTHSSNAFLWMVLNMIFIYQNNIVFSCRDVIIV